MKSKAEYAAYYESIIRTMRAVRPDATKDYLLSRILQNTAIDSMEHGDTPEEAAAMEAFARQRFEEAWQKSETVNNQN